MICPLLSLTSLVMRLKVARDLTWFFEWVNMHDGPKWSVVPDWTISGTRINYIKTGERA